jgi:hypothetical protein
MTGYRTLGALIPLSELDDRLFATRYQKRLNIHGLPSGRTWNEWHLRRWYPERALSLSHSGRMLKYGRRRVSEASESIVSQMRRQAVTSSVRMSVC